MPTKTALGVGRLQEFLGNEGRRQWTGGAGGEAAKLGRCQIVKVPFILCQVMHLDLTLEQKELFANY